MHIAIEGLDGAGKTETAKRVAAELGFRFVEKPLHYFTDERGMENYQDIINRVNACEDKHFRARFYGVGNYYVSRMAAQENIITDRHLVSNYYWNSEDDKSYFDELVRSCGTPDFTFILYVSAEERKRRILTRNPEDPDLQRKVFSDEPYQKMKQFLNDYGMNYEVIDTNNMDLEKVVKYIISQVQ